MKRSGWIFVGLALVVATGGLVAFLGPRPAEEFPLAELVPQDALFYAGFRDMRQFEDFLSLMPDAWSAEDRKRYDDARPHLSGPIAVFVDAKGEWVWLGRLTRAATLIGDVEGDAAVRAETPAAIERFRARKASIRDLPSFRQLRSRFFINLEALREGDYNAVGFDLEPGTPWMVRGRAVYKPDRYRLYVERYLQAPRRVGVPTGNAPIAVAMTDPVLRLWDEILESLAPEDHDRVEREMQILRRDLLGGQDVRDFLSRLGPRWGFSVVATPQGFPALVAWLDLPDDAAKEILEKLLDRGVTDWRRLSLSRGQVPWVEVERKENLRLLKFPKVAALRLGDAFTPAYTFAGNRLVFSTCAAAMPPPAVADGDAHAGLSIRVAAALELFRAMTPYLADETFRSEAEGMAAARYLREYNPVRLGVLSRQKPDPYAREKFLAEEKARFAAEALEELSKGQKYREEVARREKTVAQLAERLGAIDRVAGTARFTGEGLEFELKTWPRGK